MSFAAVAIGGGSLIGGVTGLIGSGIQAGAAADAAKKQEAAAREANAIQRESLAEQKRIYEQQRADQEPWRKTGLSALTDMGSSDFRRDFTAADFQKDPGFDFRMAEGQKALERSAAARGGLQSGGTLKALAQYGQNFASNEYGNAYNRFNQDRDRRFGRLSSLAGMGQNANAQNAASGQNYGNQYGAYASNVGNNLTGSASAAGAAGMAGAQAWSQGISGLGKSAMDGASMGLKNSWMDKQTKSQNTLSGQLATLSGQLAAQNYYKPIQ